MYSVKIYTFSFCLRNDMNRSFIKCYSTDEILVSFSGENPIALLCLWQSPFNLINVFYCSMQSSWNNLKCLILLMHSEFTEASKEYTAQGLEHYEYFSRAEAVKI